MFYLRIARMLNRLSNDGHGDNNLHCGGGGGGGGYGARGDTGANGTGAVFSGCAGVTPAGSTDRSSVLAPSKLRSPLGWSMGARYIGAGHAWPHGVFIRSSNGTSAATANSTNGSSNGIADTGSVQLCARASAKEINQVEFGN